MLKSLHSKLLLFVILMTFIPIIILGIVAYNSQKQAMTEQLENNLFLLADNLARDVGIFIKERINDTNIIASNPVIRDPNASKEMKVYELQNFLDIHDEYFGSIFVDKSGIVTVDMDDTVIGRDLSEREWFQKSMNGDVYFSDIYLSSVVNNPIVALSGPVKNQEDEIIGVISPSLDLDYLYEILDTYNNEQNNINSSSNAFLLNNEGEIIAHNDRTKILKENFFEANGLDKQKVNEITEEKKLFSNSSGQMYAFASIEKINGFENDWYIGVAIDKKELYAPLNSLFYKFVVFIIIYLLIIAIVIMRLSRYLVKPVTKLVDATSKFAKGEKIPYLKLGTYEELNKLSETFNKMMDKLETRERGHKKSTLILEKINNGVLSVNISSRTIITFNNKCEELFGVNKDEIIGMDVYIFADINEGFKDFFDKSSLREMIESKEYSMNNFNEFECLIKNELFVFLENTSLLSVIDNGEQQELIMVFSDITEKRLMEEKLIQSGKLEIAGQVAAGVAHEIRNPLTTIKAFFQVYSIKSDNEQAKGKYYQLIMQELNRINNILNDFLSLAKPESNNEKTDTDIIQVLNDILVLMEAQALLNEIKITKDYKELPRVYIDSKRIKQVFINLIKNSFEAMQKGGELKVSTSFLSSDKLIRIEFADNGSGMDQKTLKKLGTPFFTTKENGIGLGTMTSYRIIEEIGGRLSIESEEGVGTKFIITIPVE